MNDFKWEIEKSKYLIKDRWLKLRADTCKMPNGQMVDPYYVLEYPDWVNVVAITVDKQIVFVKQYRHALQQTLLELPCGNVEPGDETPMRAASRELLEETGYACTKLIQIGKLSPNPATHTNLTYCFLGIGAKRESEPKLDETEQIQTILIPIDKAMDIIEKGELLQALHVSSLLLSLQRFGKL